MGKWFIVRLTVVRYFLSHIQHCLVENRLNQRHTATAAGSGLGAGLDFANGLASPTLDIFSHIALGHVVTGADLGAVIAAQVSVGSPINCCGDTYRSSAFSSPSFCAPKMN